MSGRVRGKAGSRGAALIVALFAVMILTALAVTFASVVRTDVLLAGNRAAMLQSFYAAQSGVNYCRTWLADHDPSQDSLAAEADWVQVEDAQTGAIEWQYPVSSPPSVELDIPGFTVSAVIEDESARININTATESMLLALPGMTQDAADSILDWRDADEQARPMGAESDYYLSLPSPYEAANRPFDTIDELRLVRGVDTALWEGDGTDANPGLRNLVTVRSGERNVYYDSSGRPQRRLNIVTAPRDALQAAAHNKGITLTRTELDAITRQQTRLRQVGQFMNISGVSWNKRVALLDCFYVPDIPGISYTQNFTNVEGTVNLNTASEPVLEAIGLPASAAQALINQRTAQPLTTKGELATKVPGVTQSDMIRVADRIATKSSIFGVRVLGQAQDRPIRAGVFALLDRSGQPPTVLLWREEPAPATTLATGAAAQSTTPLGQVNNGS